MYPVVIGIKRMLGGGRRATDWNIVMATAMPAMLPPAGGGPDANAGSSKAWWIPKNKSSAHTTAFDQ